MSKISTASFESFIMTIFWPRTDTELTGPRSSQIVRITLNYKLRTIEFPVLVPMKPLIFSRGREIQ